MAGFKERLEVLQNNFPKTENIVACALDKYRRKEFARDDILDSIVAAITASHSDGYGRTLAAKPEEDKYGLPMRSRGSHLDL